MTWAGGGKKSCQDESRFFFYLWKLIGRGKKYIIEKNCNKSISELFFAVTLFHENNQKIYSSLLKEFVQVLDQEQQTLK